MRRGHRLRFGRLLLLLAVVGAGTPAAAQAPDISGHYEGDVIFESTGGGGEFPCEGLNGTQPVGMDVSITGERAVFIAMSIESGGSTAIEASIDQELHVYSELTPPFTGSDDTRYPFGGQFDVSGTQPSFTGGALSTEICRNEADPSMVATVGTLRWTVAAVRVSGGEVGAVSGGTDGASPSPPTTDLPLSAALARDALQRECPGLTGTRSCEDAARYASDWYRAMDNDIGALNLDTRSDAYVELDRLRGILGEAARLGSLIGGQAALVTRFPIIHSLLPVFGHLFVQGVSEAATGQFDALRTTVAQADDLLAFALAADYRSQQAA